MEPKAGEAGLEVTLQQGLGTWIMDQRSGSSTRALVGEVRGVLRIEHEASYSPTQLN